METIKTPCGHEYDEEVCPARHKAQIEFRKTGRRVDFPGCITCPHFVTKSADKPQEEKLKNKTKPVTVRTCEEPGCNVVISKDSNIISGVLLSQSPTPSQILPKQSTMSRAHLLRLHENLTEQARELMTRKNADYGANADPFANFRMSALLHIEPEFGVLLRMQDKMARLVSFLEKGELAVKEESWSDAIIDIINYSVLLCGLLQEKVNQGGAKL